MKNYDSIDNPYDAHMNRTTGGLSAVKFDPAYMGGMDTSTPAGATQTKPVSSASALEDVWISTFIRSTNWKPGAQGFSIDGRTGNAEFNNVLVRGTIESSIIRGTDLEGATITAGDVDSGDYIRIDGTEGTLTGYANDVRRIELDTGALSFYDTSGTLGGTVTGSGGGLLFTAASGDIQTLGGDLVVGGGNILPSLDAALDLGTSSQRWRFGYFGVVYINSSTSSPFYASIVVGSGSPEGVISANPGSLYLRRDGGAGTCLYVKESTGSTGWVGK